MPTLVIANKMLLVLVAAALAAPEAARDPVRRGPDPARPAGYPGPACCEHSPAGKVPILIDGDVTVWESLAIMEYAARALAAAGLAGGRRGPGARALHLGRDACRLPGAAQRLPDEPRQVVRAE